MLTLTGDLSDAFVSLFRMIDDLRGSLASVQAENKVSWFFNTSQISFDWFFNPLCLGGQNIFSGPG